MSAAETPEAIDHDRLLAEIDAEVRRRRSSGELPAGYERQLQLTFAQFAPPSTSADDIEALAAHVERSSVIDVGAPTDSAFKAVAKMKLGVRKAIAFEMRYVAAQVGELGHSIAAGLRAVATRLDAVEDAVPGLAPELVAERRSMPPRVPTAPVPEILAALDGVDGRVLHLGAGRGELVHAARDAGLDVYGIESDERLVGLDDLVRVAEIGDHLRSVGEGTLAAVVLSVEELPAATQLRLLDQAVDRLVPGGRVVVCGLDPAGWDAAVGPVRADLALGRPLSMATWVAALERRNAVVEATPATSAEGAAAHVVHGTL